MLQPPQAMVARMLAMMLVVVGWGFWACGCEGGGPAEGSGGTSSASPARVTLRVMHDPIGRSGVLDRTLAAEYEAATGVRVDFTGESISSSDMLVRTFQILGARSSSVDLFYIDVIWPPMLAEHFVDLRPAMARDLSAFSPVVMEAVTVGGKVVAAPLFSDVGLLYYRADLFAKYGIDTPPATWDELETVARRIQDAERAAGNPDFWGYGFAGKAGESLTCEALEWIASHGSPEGFLHEGAPVFSNESSLEALRRAAAWPRNIAPPDTADLDIRNVHTMFEQGNLAMMRNWTWARIPLQMPGSPMAGRVGIARMPGGDGGQFSTLGGWNLAVSRYSENPDEAIAFARWFTSAPVLARRFEEGGFPPPRPDAWPLVEPGPHLEVLEVSIRQAVLRPSRIARERYNEVSSVIFSQLNAMLRGELEPDAAARNIDDQLRDLLRR